MENDLFSTGSSNDSFEVKVEAEFPEKLEKLSSERVFSEEITSEKITACLFWSACR